MTAQSLQSCPQVWFVEDCQSVFGRLVARAHAVRESLRARLAKRTGLRELRRLRSNLLDDIGLADPERQRRQFGVYFESGSEDSHQLRNRLDIRR